MALEDLTAAVGYDPTASTAFHNRGIIQFYIAQSEKGEARAEALIKAVEDFAAASELEPTYSYILKDLGVAKVALAKELLAKGEKVKPLFTAAVEHLTQAVQLNAALVGAWYERGHAHFALKQFDLAVVDWERTLALDSSRRTKVEPLLQEARAIHEKRTRGPKP
jgi:tetratricopeptide (TPR) repeat protein